MNKPTEFQAKDRHYYTVFTERRDQFFPHLVSLKVNKIRPNGTLAWVGTPIWDEQKGDWHQWQKALPITKQELVKVLDLKKENEGGK